MRSLKLNTIFRTFLIGFTIVFLSGCGDPVEKIKQGESCIDCDLRNVDLSGTSLIGIDLSGSDLSGSNLSNVKLGKGTKLENANLSNANLSNVDATEIVLRGINFTDATLVNFRAEKVKNPVFPSFDNPSKLLSEVNSLLRKTTKTNLADAMLFNMDAGMTNQLADVEYIFNERGRRVSRDQDGHLADIYGGYYRGSNIDGLIKIKNYLDSFIDGQPMYPKVHAPFGEVRGFHPDSLINKFCYQKDYDSPYIVMDKDVALSKFSKFFDDEGDKELMLMILDHLAMGNTFKCSPVKKGASGESSLESFMYDHYNKLIEISKVGECEKTIANPETTYRNLKEGDLNTPETSLGLSILNQNVSQYHEEVKTYNTCVDSAYEIFDAGRNSLYDSLVRVVTAVNMDDYLVKLEKDQDGKRKLVAMEKFRDQVRSLTKQLYEVEDYISEINLVTVQIELAQEAMGRSLSGGDGEEYTKRRLIAKVNAFKRSMNFCLDRTFTAESDEKKRSIIIQKLQNAVKNKNSENAVNKIINQCVYDANVAFMRS